jgi:flavodoxin I
VLYSFKFFWFLLRIVIIAKLRERGAEVYPQGLKVELTPEKEEEEGCRTFGKKFVTFLRT